MEQEQNKEGKWYLNPTVIIILLFFVLGPLGLSLLYKSPKFSQNQKIIITILVLLYTGYILYLSVQMVTQFGGAMDLLNNL